MSSRGEVSGLAVGTVIALASGVGVSLSGLSSNANSLVGVAISASLLPPAVNAGMCWSYAIFGGRMGYESSMNSVDRTEYLGIGVVSLTLTLLNIACVFLAGWAIFKAKMQLQMLRMENEAEDRNMMEQVNALVSATVKKDRENTDIREALDEAIHKKREKMEAYRRATSCCCVRPNVEENGDEVGDESFHHTSSSNSEIHHGGDEAPPPPVAPNNHLQGAASVETIKIDGEANAVSGNEGGNNDDDDDDDDELLQKLHLPQDFFQSPDSPDDPANGVPAMDLEPRQVKEESQEPTEASLAATAPLELTSSTASPAQWQSDGETS